MTDADSKKPQVVKITFQGAGPLTRSTVGSEALDTESEVVNDALHWIWSWRLQVSRLAESHDLEWSGVTGLDQRKAASRFSFDEHLLAVTGWNLARALKRAQPLLSAAAIGEEQHEALRLLRHLYEHWDEQRPAFHPPNAALDRSAAAFAAQFPQGRPWTMVFDKTDWLLGGILPLNQFTRALIHIEAALLAAKPQERPGE